MSVGGGRSVSANKWQSVNRDIKTQIMVINFRMKIENSEYVARVPSPPLHLQHNLMSIVHSAVTVFF